MEWISNEEKYALIGLSLAIDDNLDFTDSGVRALTEVDFAVPIHWKEWLGSIRTEQISDTNLFLVATSADGAPHVLDAVNSDLERKVWNFYLGLLLAAPVWTRDKPIRLTGARTKNETDVRQQADIDAPILTIMTEAHRIRKVDLEAASALGRALESLVDPQRTGKNWRLVRTLMVYFDACTTRDIMDRIHQFSRCLEGLIHPSQGNTKKQFKSRTVTFIGPGHHDLIGNIYDIRSAVEHLHENDYMHPFSRERRFEVFRLEAIVSEIARACLRRVMTTPSLRHHFGNSESLNNFWALPDDERRSLWGQPIDPFQTLRNVSVDQLTDEALGAEP